MEKIAQKPFFTVYENSGIIKYLFTRYIDWPVICCQKGMVGKMMGVVRKRVLFIAVFAFLIISTGNCQELIEAGVVSAEEYAVYSVLLTGPSDSIYVVKEQAKGEREPFTVDTAAYFEKQSGIKLDKEMVEQFIALNNAAPLALENKFRKGLNVYLISGKEEQDIFKGADGWDIFRKKYPNACITGLSRVAFNAAKDMAFVYTDIMCDAMAGNGSYLLLKKENAKWIVVAHARAWIS